MQPEGFDDALGASYRLLDRLGEGASGEVWRAVDKRTDEIVATKLLRREHLADRDLVGRFVQERSVLTTLRHPAVVAVRDLVVEGERLAIVMEHVDGGSLRDVLRERGTLTPALAVDVAAAVLEGLASAHQRDVVHRDVKPDNVLLTRDWESGEPGSVKLVDFGIARIITDRQRTATGLLGTPEYMSPELLTRGTAESPADVYGVGIMLYELLAGRTPFAGPGNEYTIAHRHVTAEPPPLDVPAPLAAQLEALLEKDPT
ncbi:serine/threonine-protein kinase, partial [Nocardioides aquaticus]